MGEARGWGREGKALWLEPHSMAARAAGITCFELMYCDLFAPCQLQADCPVCYFPSIALNTVRLCGWMNGRRKLPDAQIHTVYTFPFAAHQDPGAEAVTQLGQTG